ncbi:MAG TPA: iron-sulfur cluster assembly accessory protein [Rubrivivax sp.]|nr:iron-sulfur cluster assembly accessory protein [Rubrivivax sp.]
MTFTVTAAASQEILAAAERSSADGLALRVAARQGADGTLEYGMGFDEQREDDEPAEFGGLTVLLGSPSRALLDGTVLDYVEVAPGRHDFIFIPPQSAATVGDEPAATSLPQGACGNGGCGHCGT